MIIRPVAPLGTAVLSPKGELLAQSEKTADLFEEEKQSIFASGEQLGEKKGYEKARQELEVLFNLVQTMVHKLIEHKEKLLDQMKPEIVEFSLQICEKFVRRELSQPENFVKLINRLLHTATSHRDKESIQLVLAPDDLHLVETHLDRLEYDRTKIDKIHFLSDPMMRRGDVRIDTQTSLLNFDLAREFLELKLKCLNY